MSLETILRYVHVIFGFAGLAAFWVPIVAAKGSRVHRRFGRVFAICAYVVLASALVSVGLNLAPYAGPNLAAADHPTSFAFWLFLGYLAVVTGVIVHHGEGVLKAKRAPEKLRTPLRLTLAVLAMAASAGLIAVAVSFDSSARIILLALAPIGLLSGWGILNYLRGKNPSPRAWMYEHLGAMLGGGIAFHTAFAVFGSARLFDLGLSGWVAVIPWILPAAIGVPATVLWTRHYRRKFGELV